MKILQFCPTLSYGDAIGNEVLLMKNIISSLGYTTEVYCEYVHLPYTEKHGKNINRLGEVNQDDIIILHLSTGSSINELFEKIKCRKIIRYHNITPPEFFIPYNSFYSGINEWALQSAEKLAKKVDYCLAASNYNKSDLISMGYKCHIDVVPLLLDFDAYRNTPSESVIEQYYDDKYVNILFVGRIAPNKKIENLIMVFGIYQKYFNRKCRLFLVGSYDENDRYYIRLRKYVTLSGIDNVVFSGHIKLKEVLAYYHLADVFLCMSEHEGFCVPLVEAMFFGIPIIAYDRCAVKEILGGIGFLIDEKNFLVFAKSIDYLIRHPETRGKIISAQTLRLSGFDTEKTTNQFKTLLNRFISAGRNKST
jgi:glycosyltransferase involved in cell wall biosynthesis